MNGPGRVEDRCGAGQRLVEPASVASSSSIGLPPAATVAHAVVVAPGCGVDTMLLLRANVVPGPVGPGIRRSRRTGSGRTVGAHPRAQVRLSWRDIGSPLNLGCHCSQGERLR